MRPAILLLAAACWGNTGAGLPKVGCMAESGASVTVWGVRGSFVRGEAGCEVERPSDGWSVAREGGRLWKVRVDPESGGETAREPLGEEVSHALVISSGGDVLEARGGELRAGDWRQELPSPVSGLRWMSAEWVQVITEEGSWAFHTSRHVFRLPGGAR